MGVQIYDLYIYLCLIEHKLVVIRSNHGKVKTRQWMFWLEVSDSLSDFKRGVN